MRDASVFLPLFTLTCIGLKSPLFCFILSSLHDLDHGCLRHPGVVMAPSVRFWLLGLGYVNQRPERPTLMLSYCHHRGCGKAKGGKRNLAKVIRMDRRLPPSKGIA